MISEEHVFIKAPMQTISASARAVLPSPPSCIARLKNATHLVVGTYLLEDGNDYNDEDSGQSRSGSLILYEICDGKSLYIHLLSIRKDNVIK